MSNRSTSCDVAVVGGGVVGLAVAWRAAQRGLSVTVLDRAQPGAGTSRVAAGMLAPVTEADPSEPVVLRLGLAAARAYPSFVAELAEASGRDPGYLACGTLVVARDADEAEALAHEHDFRRRLELPVKRLRASEARALEPALAPALRLALSVPDDHAVDPRQLTSALVDGVRCAGAALVRASVVSLIGSGERVVGVVLNDGQRLGAEHVVIAAGAWSERIGGLDPEARVPLRPVKGQILFLRDPTGPGLLGRVVRMSDGYLVPRGDGRYVLGATMEERGFDTSVTAGAAFKLLRDASELVPGIGELVIEELCAGLRPATPDNVPAIGPGALTGLHWAVGHYRNGVLLAPLTAELVLAGIEGGALPDEFRAALAPSRFTRAPARA